MQSLASLGTRFAAAATAFALSLALLAGTVTGPSTGAAARPVAGEQA
jgi:hypothetical protein